MCLVNWTVYLSIPLTQTSILILIFNNLEKSPDFSLYFLYSLLLKLLILLLESVPSLFSLLLLNPHHNHQQPPLATINMLCRAFTSVAYCYPPILASTIFYFQYVPAHHSCYRLLFFFHNHTQFLLLYGAIWNTKSCTYFLIQYIFKWNVNYMNTTILAQFHNWTQCDVICFFNDLFTPSSPCSKVI